MIWSLPSLLLTPLWPVGLACEVYVSFLITACNPKILYGPIVPGRSACIELAAKLGSYHDRLGLFHFFASGIRQPLPKTVRANPLEVREICTSSGNSQLISTVPVYSVRT
jgi:hypothetical protein